MPLSLQTPLVQLKSVGLKYAERLKKVGLETIQDLLFYWPHRYENLTDIKSIIDVRPEEKVVIQGQVMDIRNSHSPKRRLAITEAIIADRTSQLRAVWFNQPYLMKSIAPGQTINLAGKARLDNQGIFLSSPTHEIINQNNHETANAQIHTGRLVPIYHESYRLSSRYLRYLIKYLMPLAQQIPDWLPQEIKQAKNLMSLGLAIRQIHFPDNSKLAEAAKKRLSFNEMLLIQLSVLSQKQKLKQISAPIIPLNLTLVKNFVNSLPFQLTNCQRQTAWEILQDLQKPQPMNRLLEGDVGSGKTVVAALASLNTAKANFQVALMAPTEILACQHFQEISKLLKCFNIPIGLLTSSESKINNYKNKDVKLNQQNQTLARHSKVEAVTEAEESQPNFNKLNKKSLLQKIKSGYIKIIIGTHALIQKSVQFDNIGLVVIDEQHRFGVTQRSQLTKNKQSQLPHLLSMTATPIPRSLALTLYGDLDLSLLDELPQGRQKIITQIVAASSRQTTYQFIRDQIKLGRQAFIICPRIEIKENQPSSVCHSRGGGNLNPAPTNSQPPQKNYAYANATAPKINHQSFFDITPTPNQEKESEIKAVTREYDKFSKNIFPDLSIAMLHGKLKPKDKQQVMADFKNKQTDVLISTSVVEVGVDVPNATIMMIEGAEYFGLAQLHQFRGRVGRGRDQSYCFIFTASPSAITNQRLKALLTAKNGFELAEKDLEIRGPGQFFGQQQSGLPDLAMQSLTNPKLIYHARQAAQNLLDQDPQIKKHPLLKAKLVEFKAKIHWE